jgi:hypothetical protein
VWWYMPVISATWETDIGGSQFEAGTGQKRKTLKSKSTGGVASAVELYTSKCKALCCGRTAIKSMGEGWS